MMNQRTLSCIVCPKECALEVSMLDKVVTYISGYSCERGRQYAHDEILCPSRIITTTVSIEGGVCKRLPVRSSSPFPKERINEWMREVKELRVKAPVQVGEVLIAGILGTGTDVISSKSVAQDQ
ncbi:CxxC motif-containing protein [Paenibacillus forsythiae]|uniref:CxxC motif-containing protein n=1 Tax=Paenibacillus forsythiae TaxID=365616 RepID=A0ABU3HAJ1_9BACL|nr:DUF1667 domain-containing protein [Paenibacillus forsythiae]MDT3427834.1 CxxC motif-containing protein [Paenibacillus forsythiae]